MQVLDSTCGSRKVSAGVCPGCGQELVPIRAVLLTERDYQGELSKGRNTSPRHRQVGGICAQK